MNRYMNVQVCSEELSDSGK